MSSCVCNDRIITVEKDPTNISTTSAGVVEQDERVVILPASGRLRMHRSAVRPFFCCGSELSLISINDQQELRPLGKPSLSEKCHSDIESNGVCIETLLPFTEEESWEDVDNKRDRPFRKKSVDGCSRKMSRKSWAIKLRGKLSKRLQSMDENGSVTGCCSTIESGCKCTAYRVTEGAAAAFTCHGTAVAERETSAQSTSTHHPAKCDQGVKAKSGKSKGRGKIKSNHSNLVGSSTSSTMKAWVVGKPFNENTTRVKMQSNQSGCTSKRNPDGKKLVSSNRFSGLLAPAFQKHCVISLPHPSGASSNQNDPGIENEEDEAEDDCQYSDVPSLGCRAPYVSVHSQVDYVHCLVPDLSRISNCGFYWGIMDRYEAERLLENKPEGTFLLRDSAQDEFLFSVSFRRYGRSLHARVEQYNHKFSFDSHDPGVFAAGTVCGLIEHYKDPSCCMFFEPMLTLPLNRSFPFSLQQLARSTIVSSTTYDGISDLPLPNQLQNYLRYYHYKHKVRVRNLNSTSS